MAEDTPRGQGTWDSTGGPDNERPNSMDACSGQGSCGSHASVLDDALRTAPVDRIKSL